MAAKPPSVALASSAAGVGRWLISGPANAVTPAARAPGPHLLPEATEEPHPTSAWPATLAKNAGEPNSAGLCPGPNVMSPTALNAIAVAKLMTPARSAMAFNAVGDITL